MPHAISTFPPKPLEGINWAALGSTITEDNGHIECRYNVATGVWTEPTLIKDPYIKVHGLAPGLNYGQQAYEGMKAYRSPTDNINIFRPQYHAKRLANSSSCVSIPPIPENIYLDAVNLAVACNAEYVPPHSASALMYIRPVVFGSAGNLGLTPPSEYTFAVYTQPGNAYHGIQPMPAVVMEEFDRSAPRGTGGYKVGGNYAPCIRWQGKARQMGYGLTLHLDSRTQSEIEEFSTSGFIGVRRDGAAKTTLCIPDSTNIVDSVTSDSIAQIGASLGWIVEKRKIHYTELRYFTEVLAVGTAASIVPIASIHRISTDETFVFNHSGEGSAVKPGPVCLQLSQILLDIQKGTIKDSWGWRWEVNDPSTVAIGNLQSKQSGEMNGEEVNGKEGNGREVSGKEANGGEVGKEEVSGNEANGREVSGKEANGSEVSMEKVSEESISEEEVIGKDVSREGLQDVSSEKVIGEVVSGERVSEAKVNGSEANREGVSRKEANGGELGGEEVNGDEVIGKESIGEEVSGEKVSEGGVNGEEMDLGSGVGGKVKEEYAGGVKLLEAKLGIEEIDEREVNGKSVNVEQEAGKE